MAEIHVNTDEGSGARQLKYRHFSVAVKDVGVNDPTVEVIGLSDALVEFLRKDPVCGRSDYSHLPGVRTDVCSSWRSFAEYPRRANSVASPLVSRRGNTSANSEERHRRNYEARIRREKLTLQRVAKRERLRAQQRERHRQQTLLFKLQHQATEKGESISTNPGVIISSPKKGSPTKLWKENRKSDSKHQRKSELDGNSKKSPCGGVAFKSLSGAQDKCNARANNQIWTFLDDVVSTTSVHRADEYIQITSEDLQSATLSSEVPDITLDKILNVSSFFGETEDNPVTSSQDLAEKSLSQSSTKPAPSAENKSASTSWTVTSSTAPEIAVADSSTSSCSKRKTRNVKRVNYTEMLDDDFDQDGEQSFRESKTSGRKIRPVKRTLEKAIVDASLKKSPRKRKSAVDTKSPSSSQHSAASSTNTDTKSEKMKRTKSCKNVSLASTASSVKNPNEEVNVSPGYKENQVIPDAYSAKFPNHSVPALASDISQRHSLMSSSYVSHVTTPAHSPLHGGSLPVGHMYMPNPYESSGSASSTRACQSGIFPFQQQLYSTSSGHSIPQNPALIMPPTNLHNPAFSNSSLIMQSQFLKPLPVMSFLDFNRYPIDSFPSPQINSQTHIISPQFSLSFQSPPRGALVYDMNQPTKAPPNFLLESQTSTNAPNSKESHTVGTSQHGIQLEAAINKERLLFDNSAKSLTLSDINSSGHILPVNNEMVNPHASNIQQQKTVLGVSNVSAQERVYSLPQHFLTVSVNNTGLGDSGKRNLSPANNKNVSKDTADFHLCKKQSQFDIETMLKSIQKNPASERNHINSKSEIHEILQSPVTKSSQIQKFADSLCTLESQKTSAVVQLPQKASDLTHKQTKSMIGQTMGIQSSSQSVQGNQAKFIGPPPPLIAISDICHLPMSVASYEKQQGTASIPYEDIKSPAAHQNKSAPESAIYDLPPTSIPIFPTNERTSLQPESSRQRPAITTLPNSASQQELNCSLRQQNLQSQPPYPKPRHNSYEPSHTDQTKPMQGNSGAQQAHIPGMPALLGPLNCSVSARSDKVIYQKKRMPVPELPHTFQTKPPAHTIISTTNAALERRAAPVLIRSLGQQVPTQGRHQLDKNMPKAPGTHRLFSSHRPNLKPASTTAQQANFQKPRQTVAPNLRHLVVNQPASNAFQGSRASDSFWLALLRQQESVSGKSPLEARYHNQISPKGVGNRFPLQPTQQRVQLKTVQLTQERRPANTGGAWLSGATSGVQNLSAESEAQHGPHYMLPQRALDALPNVALDRVGMILQNGSANVTIQRASTNSVSTHAVKTDKPLISASVTLQEVDIKPVRSTLLHALDLSHTSSSHVGQMHQIINATPSASSVNRPITSSLLQDQLTTLTSAPRVAYDYPLTKTQIKQEFMVHSDQSENDCSEVSQPGLRRVSQSVLQGVSQSVLQKVSQPDLQRVSQPGPHRDLQSGLQRISQPGLQRASQLGPRRISQPGPQRISQPSPQGISQSGLQGVSQTSLQGSNTSLRAGVTLCPTILAGSSTVTSTISPAPTNQNSTTSLSKVQTSTQVIYSQDHDTTNIYVTSAPPISGSSSNLPVREHINIKVEANLSHGNNAVTMSSSSMDTPATSNASQATSLASTLQNAPAAVVTAFTSEPVISSLSTHTKPIAENMQNIDTSSTPSSNNSRTAHVSTENSAAADQNGVVKTATLPAHISIKQEIHLDFISEKSISTSVSSLQPSYTNRPQSSSKQVCSASTTHNHTTFAADNNRPSVTVSDSRVSSAGASATVSLPQLNVQSLENINHHIHITDRNIGLEVSSNTESAIITDTVTGLINSQSITSNVASIQTPDNNSVEHVYPAISKSVWNQEPSKSTSMLVEGEGMAVINKALTTLTIPLTMNSSSISEHPIEVTKVMKPVCPSTVTSEMATAIQMPASNLDIIHDVSHHNDENNESSRTKLAVVIPSLQQTGSPNKQPSQVTCSPYTATNDPLFAWYIDSPKHLDSFSFDDMTGPVSLYDQRSSFACRGTSLINNMYTVTVSVPCSEGSSLLPYHTDTSLVDVSAVKVEPNTQPAALNQKEVIDLCVSDNDEDNLVDIDTSSCKPFLTSNTSTFEDDPCFNSQAVLSIGNAVLSSSQTENNHLPDVQSWTPDSCHPCSLSLNSYQHEVMNPERSSAMASPGHSKCAAGQIMKSPLTGRDVVMSDEQMSYIRNRLARISGDLSTLTASSGDTSANIHCTPPRQEANRSFIDLVIESSGSGQRLFNKDSAVTNVLPALAEHTYTSVNRSKGHEHKKVFRALEIDTGNKCLARVQAHGVVVKKEHIEAIYIDDDDDDIDDAANTATSDISYLSSNLVKRTYNSSRIQQRCQSDDSSSTSTNAISPLLPVPPGSATSMFPYQKDPRSPSGSRSSLMSPSGSTSHLLASVANWSGAQVSDWLKNHKLDKICPNLSSLDGRGLQRMAFEHQRDPDMFYTRVKKTLGLTFFQTMVICRSMKELNDTINND